jgi:cholesterol transport system auxiliary component
MRSLGHAIVAVALGVAVTACSITRPAPVKQSYVIQATRQAPLVNVAATPAGAALKVDLFRSAAAFQGRGFVYRRDESRYESDYYHEFFAAPAALVRDATTAWLSRSGLFSAVLPYGSAGEAQYHLEALVTELYADTRAGRAATVVGVHFYLSDWKTASPAVVFSRLITRRGEIATADADAVASGFNACMSGVLQELETELSRAAPGRRSSTK